VVIIDEPELGSPIGPVAKIRVGLLGPVEAQLDGDAIAVGGPKERALLAMLALQPGSTVSAEQLIDGLWGEEPPATASKLVQQYVSHLRKAIAAAGHDEVIATHGRGYELRVSRDQVDVGRFERLLAQGASRDALALWRGTPLADVAGEPFAAAEARRLEEMRTAATELAIEQDLDAGRHREVLPELEGLLAKEPLRERLHALRMLALYRAGRQAEALEAYRQARVTLVEEVGIEPGPELRRLQEQILRQEPGLLARERLDEAAARAASERAGWRQAQDDLAARVVELQALREREALATAPSSPAGCPFKGLASFDVDDADVFFGRERLVAELVARVPGSRLMAIVGPSGSGKSSALGAGLLASLASGVLPGSDAWPLVVFRPGLHPARALEGALEDLPSEGSCVLAVDQFEELFTVCAEERERTAAVDGLLRCARDPERTTLVLVAIRADFYGHCAAYPELSRALDANHVLVGPMHAEELRRAIELPARRAGRTADPPLVDALVADVEGEAGSLPWLSTTLLELWEGEGLTLDAYNRSGGVRGAVARMAEGVHERLDADGQAAARRVMLRLAGDGDVRARVPIGELEEVVEVLAAERLVTLGEDEAEIAHEALLRDWPRLREWLEEDAEGQRLHRHLTHAARVWLQGGRDPAELYRGSRLVAAIERADDAALNSTEREFLAASRAAAEQETERERRTNRRLRALLAGVGALLVAAVVAGAVAVSQRGEARDAALAADAQRLGAEALTEERLDSALLLARAGVELDASPATRSSLLSVLVRRPAALGELRGDGWPLYSVAASRDGALLAIGDERGGVIFYDVRTRRRLPGAYRAPEGLIQHLAFSPDGTLVAVVTHGEEGTTRVDLVDPRTGRRARRVELPRFPAEAFYVLAPVEFGPGGRHLVAQTSSVDFAEGPPSVLHRIEVATGKVVRSRRVGGHGAWRLSATRDRSRFFLTVPRDDRTYEIDPATLTVRRSWPAGAHAGTVSGDGRVFALGGDDGSVRLLDLRTGDVRAFEDGHDSGADMQLAFTPDGRTLITSNAKGEVLAWDVARGAIRERLNAHSETVYGLAVAADSRTLFTAGVDAKLVIWDLAGDRRLDRRFPAGPPMTFDDGSPKGLARSPDGRTVAITQDSGRVDLVNTRTLELRRSAKVLDGAALAADFSPDGRLLAVSGEGNRVLLMDAGRLNSVRELRGLPADGHSQGLAFSPDGRHIAAAAFLAPAGGEVRLWDVRTGEQVGEPMRLASVDLAFSPDGQHLAAAVLEGDSEVRSVPDGRLVARLRTGDDGRSVAFSPDGQTFALGLYGGRVRMFSTRDWKPVGRTIEGHRDRVTALEYSRDGQRLLTGAADGTVRLWTSQQRQPIGSALTLAPESYVSATFAPDGSEVFAVPDRGPAARWNMRPEAWARHACAVAGRPLTEREWRDALPQRPFQPVC
jgi:DNA-binding SARP family transcriptional activator/WD40 repeat protein